MNSRKRSSLPDSLSSLSLCRPNRPFGSSSLLASAEWYSDMDLLATLGDDGDGSDRMGSHQALTDSYGNTGCVNALDWEEGGKGRLASAGDDTKICIWAPSASVTGAASFRLQTTIATGHSQNIFGVKFSPHKASTLLSCAGDGEVRIFDINSSASRLVNSGSRSWTHHDEDGGACIRVLRCHRGRVKRIATEDSPDVFLTCSEDGTVRQHDLRTTHVCPPRRPAFLRRPATDDESAECGPPLLSYPGLSLYTLTLSKARPHLFVVAGRCPTAFLHDRRMLRSAMTQDWGIDTAMNDEALTQCVRRFGVPDSGRNLTSIVAAKLSDTNPRDLVLSYSSGPIYLFDTDAPICEPPIRQLLSTSSRVALLVRAQSDSGRTSSKRGDENLESPAGKSTAKRRKEDPGSDESPSDVGEVSEEHGGSEKGHEEDVITPPGEREGDFESDESANDSQDEDDGEELDQPRVTTDDEMSESESEGHASARKRGGWDADVPLVEPKEQYEGHANSETIKEVNIGGGGEYVMSGSDDGNFFVWKKEGTLVGIWRGDQAVVNVTEPHPRLPLLAVSGIDSSVKIFGPSQSSSGNLLADAERITSRNKRRVQQGGLEIPSQALLALLGRALPQFRNVTGNVTLNLDTESADESGEREQCLLM